MWFEAGLDQHQLVPSGGISGPEDQHAELTFFCHYPWFVLGHLESWLHDLIYDIRVQLRELKCMELVS
jgi:hypothetical protein